MPTYQYACTQCDHRFEAVQAFTDPSLTVCPECSGQLRKVYGSVGVVFKGSGFYRTDSRADSKRSGSSDNGKAKTDTKSEATAGGKAESKSDGKASTANGGSSAGSSGSSGSSAAASSSTSSSSSRAAAG